MRRRRAVNYLFVWSRAVGLCAGAPSFALYVLREKGVTCSSRTYYVNNPRVRTTSLRVNGHQKSKAPPCVGRFTGLQARPDSEARIPAMEVRASPLLCILVYWKKECRNLRAPFLSLYFINKF